MSYIGSHISSSKGYLAMGKQALKLGANTFAFFTRNPRGGNVKPLDKADVQAYNELAHEQGFGPVVAHAPYTYNACAAKRIFVLLPAGLCRKIWSGWKKRRGIITISTRAATWGRGRKPGFS